MENEKYAVSYVEEKVAKSVKRVSQGACMDWCSVARSILYYSVKQLRFTINSSILSFNSRPGQDNIPDQHFYFSLQHPHTVLVLRAEVLETMLYGCVTWNPRACCYDTLRQTHDGLLTRCIGWRTNNFTDHPISYG